MIWNPDIIRIKRSGKFHTSSADAQDKQADKVAFTNNLTNA